MGRCATVIGSLSVLAMAFYLSGQDNVLAQQARGYPGTSDQQAACTPDVLRLCRDDIPIVSRIVACLKRQRPLLSERCRAVFEPRTRRRAALIIPLAGESSSGLQP